MMPDDIRLAYCQKYERLVDTSDRVTFILSILPENHRLSFLSRYENLLHPSPESNGFCSMVDNYIKVTGLLPVPHRFDFALRHENIAVNLYLLASIMQKLDQQSSSKLFALYQGEIPSYHLHLIV